MTRRKVSFLQGTVAAPYKLPAEDHRLNHAGLWVPSSAAGAGLRIRSGIVAGPGNPGQVSVVAGGVNVNAFQAAIQGTLNGAQGVYEVTSDAVEFRAVTAASAAEFRRGYVVARVYDQLNAGTGAVKDDWDVEVVYGPNAATAGAAILPPVPDNTLVLREFAVSNTGVITLAGALPPWTVARGGIPPVAADDAVAPAYDGQYRDHPLFGLQRGFGGAWGQAAPPSRALLVPSAAAGVTYATGAYTAVPWAAPAAGDLVGFSWSAAQPTRLVCDRAGLILVSGSLGWGNHPTGDRMAILRKNGVDVLGSASNGKSSAAYHHVQPIAAQLIPLAAGEYLEMAGHQTSGVALAPAPPNSNQSGRLHALRVADLPA